MVDAPLIEVFQDQSRNPFLYEENAETPGKIGANEATKCLIGMLQDESENIHNAVIWALGKIGDPKVENHSLASCEEQTFA